MSTKPTFTTTFADNLAQLPAINGLTAVELFDANGAQVARIENKPGQAGSLRIYVWLASEFGSITPEAAALGLRIYAEHTADAQAHPGKHPNIDRLFAIRSAEQALTLQAVPA
ncbi:MAG: DUF2322 family protein [Burkholderiaceae bacterium]|nr:MAG: DUF2322 family protein [Burkholderiaceae bacterium]